MQFPIGSTVKLADHTGDDEIDRYLGQTLIVSEYREIPVIAYYNHAGRPIFDSSIPNYSLITPDGSEITANEYELRASNGGE